MYRASRFRHHRQTVDRTARRVTNRPCGSPRNSEKSLPAKRSTARGGTRVQSCAIAVSRSHHAPTQLSSRSTRTSFEEIRRKYAVDDPGDAPPKYLDLEHWIRTNLQRVRELGLDYAPRSRILDLGCGAGYFLYINKLLGHEILGLDLDDLPMFRELIELLQIPRTIARIEAFQPLPKFDRKFDIITAYLICFNNHKSDKLWGPAEWDYFLNDVAGHLAPNGRLWLELNREYDGSYLHAGIESIFRTTRSGIAFLSRHI